MTDLVDSILEKLPQDMLSKLDRAPPKEDTVAASADAPVQAREE